MGLSTSHISPAPKWDPTTQEWTVRYAAGGNLVQVQPPSLDWPRRPRRTPRHRRGRIAGFARASRLRLFRWINSLNQSIEGLPLFVTLTYPGDVKWNAVPPKQFKRHLDTFLKRLRRAFADAHGIWRLEPQTRGAPHYHLLIFGYSFMAIGRLSRMWWEVVGSGEASHLKCGVDIDRPTSWRRVVAYVAKYLAKRVDDLPAAWAHVGRWWGAFNRRKFSRQVAELVVCPDVGARLRRTLSRAVFKGDRIRRLEFLAREWLSISSFWNEERLQGVLDRLKAKIRRGQGSTRHRRWYLQRLAARCSKQLPGEFSSGFDASNESDAATSTGWQTWRARRESITSEGNSQQPPSNSDTEQMRTV
jgi:hypothetical protein